jgi:hypothetical protein
VARRRAGGHIKLTILAPMAKSSTAESRSGSREAQAWRFATRECGERRKNLNDLILKHNPTRRDLIISVRDLRSFLGINALPCLLHKRSVWARELRIQHSASAEPITRAPNICAKKRGKPYSAYSAGSLLRIRLAVNANSLARCLLITQRVRGTRPAAGCRRANRPTGECFI